ncbi:MAG TPA: hypothetical protein VHB97_02480, partial [Polyangia bacterium]|nr:hypothetical protein [Polyangia bacterium]
MLLPVVMQWGVDGETALHAPSGSDVDKHETQVMATQMGVVPPQVQPAMSTASARSAPPVDETWHWRATRSHASPLGHGRESSQYAPFERLHPAAAT